MPSFSESDLDINSDRTHFPTSWHKSPNQVSGWKDGNDKDFYFKTVSPSSSNSIASNSSGRSESPLLNIYQENVKLGKHCNFSNNPLLRCRAPRSYSDQDHLPLPPQQNGCQLRHYSGTIYRSQSGCLLPPYYQTPTPYYPANSAPRGPTQYYIGLPSYYDQAQASR